MEYKPLKGVRVVEWADGFVAPYCTRLLADFGAEVIKIERLQNGDRVRTEPPFLPGVPTDRASGLFVFLNAGKQSVTFDPRTADGAALLRRLLANSSLFVQSQHEGGEASSLLDSERLRFEAPTLSVLTITGFGLTGPRSRFAYSDLTLQHAAGFAWHQTTPVQEPENRSPLGGADRELPLSAGLGAAIAAFWALMKAGSGSGSSSIDFSIEDFYAQVLVDPLASWCRGERKFERQRKDGETPTIAGGIVWILSCSDGWVMISPREQHQWARWVEVMGSPAWAADEKMCATRALRQQHSAKLQMLMSEWSATLPRHTVGQLAQDARVACFPISTPDDLLNNEQLHHRRFFDHVDLPDGRQIFVPGLPFELRATDGARSPRARQLIAPGLGNANASIMVQEQHEAAQHLRTV